MFTYIKMLKMLPNGNESINNPFIHGSKKRWLDLVFEQFNKVEEKQLYYN